MARWGYYNESINPKYGTDKFGVLYSGAGNSDKYAEYAGTFNDITFEGNGTYTVSLTGADFAEETSISQLHIATDIPATENINFSDVTVKINGKKLITFDEAYLENEDKFLQGGKIILAINHWRKPLEQKLIDSGLPVEGNGVDCLWGTGDDKIEVIFTVSGFAYDKPEEPLLPQPQLPCFPQKIRIPALKRERIPAAIWRRPIRITFKPIRMCLRYSQ